MTDLATYLDYGGTEISDDLNPERARQPEKQEPSNERKKMLVDMLGTSLEYGRAAAYEGRWEGWRTGAYNALGGEGAQYWDEYSVPREDIIPGADRWLQNESGFTYDELIGLLEAGEMQDGIDWAWSLTGAPTVQLDTASNVLAFANPFSAVIDYGHAAWDLASGDVSGARNAWDNVGDRLYGYDPNPYGSQAANVLGVHNWQDAIWAGLDVIDLVSLGFGGEIIRPMRQAMAGIARRQGRPEAARAIERRLAEEFAERAARGADAELRTVWDNISTGEREVIEADYRAVFPDADPDPVDMMRWYEQQGPAAEADRLAAAIVGEHSDLFEYWQHLAEVSGYADSIGPGRWAEEGGLTGVLRDRTSPAEQFYQGGFAEHAAAGGYELHDVFSQIRDFATKRLDELESQIGGPKRPDPFIDRVLPEVPNAPQDWMYYTDRSGYKQYKGASSFENPDALVPQPRMGDAGLDLSDTPEAGVYSSKELAMKELGWTEEQYEQARTVWANDPQRIEDQIAKEAERLDMGLSDLFDSYQHAKESAEELAGRGIRFIEWDELDPELRDAIFNIADDLQQTLGEKIEGRNLISEVEKYLNVTGTPPRRLEGPPGTPDDFGAGLDPSGHSTLDEEMGGYEFLPEDHPLYQPPGTPTASSMSDDDALEGFRDHLKKQSDGSGDRSRDPLASFDEAWSGTNRDGLLQSWQDEFRQWRLIKDAEAAGDLPSGFLETGGLEEQLELLGPPNRPEGYNRPDGDPLDRRPGPEQREPYPDTFTPDEVDEIVRNEGGLTDAEIEREMRRSGAYDDPYGRGGELTDADLDRLAKPEPGISADPLDEEIAREIGPGPGPGWKTAADIPASKASQVWRTPDNVWGTATDEELLVLLHHAQMETRRKIDPSLSMIGENRQREFLAAQQADWASRELTNRGYTPTRGIDDPWQELNWGNIGVDRHPSGELFKDFDYEDTLLGIQAKVKSWYDTEYWPQQVAGSKTGLQTPPDLDLDIGPFGQRMGWWLPGTGSEFNADGTQMRLRFYSDQKLIAYMDDRYFQPGRQPRALEYRKMFEDEYARRRAIEAETGKPYDPGPRPPGHPSTWRLPEE